MKRLKKLIFVAHPQHAILGFIISLVSLVLIFNDYYYFWPPFMARFLNDDAVGVAGLILGINLMIWARKTEAKVKVNFWLLDFSCAFWAYEATAELIHGMVSKQPHMVTAAIVEFGMFLFTLSIIGRSKKIDTKTNPKG